MNELSEPLPLPTLLSHALVAFTIEFDNEFEHRMPHRTAAQGRSESTSEPDASRGAAGPAPWLVSMAMWTNCMRFLDGTGIRVRDLEHLALTKTNIDGMRRWGYVEIVRDPADDRPKPPSGELVIRPTRAGRLAQEVWRPLTGEIEQRWYARFGRGRVEQLRQSLSALVGLARRPLPDCLPILGYGLWTSSRLLSRRATGTDPGARATTQPADVSGLDLPTLLSRALLSFTLAYERESAVSLAVGANLLRVLDEDGVRVRDLPQLTGIAKPGIEMALGILRKQDFAEIGPDPDGSRWKIARLTRSGRIVREAHLERLGVIEDEAGNRFGAESIGSLRRSLAPLVGDPNGQLSPLYGGLAPYPDGWRAKVREPDTLPHFPMVLHRGGYPDGS